MTDTLPVNEGNTMKRRMNGTTIIIVFPNL